MGLTSAFKASWQNAADNTSISGAANAVRSEHPVRKACWVFIFIVCLAATVWSVWAVVADYLTYPVDTTITLQHQSRVSCSILEDRKVLLRDQLRSHS